ncbi:MAG: rhomboid family intramembrane serine protease [Erysipelotrichaceae bacterium]|nr:rhomboid family intramembrane serine protease [Erysipelotrichaceae bacterium]MDY5251389.1 rhomboid family intramembrane serine protease [Erysipelotrichaceae bacterium]
MNFIKRINYNAPVTLTFAFICLLATLLDQLTLGYTTYHIFSVYRSSLLDPLFYVRLFAHVFGHADLAHLTSNMTLFLLLGPLLEEKYGSKAMIEIIMVVALITGVIHIIVSNNALLGASGVVFCFIILASITGKNEGIPLTFIIVAILYLSNEIITGIVNHDTISQMTHIIGGLCGTFIGLKKNVKFM